MGKLRIALGQQASLMPDLICISINFYFKRARVDPSASLCLIFAGGGEQERLNLI